jgi:hypothetical protein
MHANHILANPGRAEAEPRLRVLKVRIVRHSAVSITSLPASGQRIAAHEQEASNVPVLSNRRTPRNIAWVKSSRMANSCARLRPMQIRTNGVVLSRYRTPSP